MKFYLDTSTDTCILKLDDHAYNWTPERGRMAEGIFRFIRDALAEQGAGWSDITEITYFAGPGTADRPASFTGLRIGAAIVNTLAHELKVPLYDQNGRLRPVILPDYGRSANVGRQRK